MPIEVKKTPLKSARNGSTSESARSPYSDSEITRPARKAPIASEKPTEAVASAVAMAMNPTARVKTSRSRSATTRSSVQRTAIRPPATSATTSASPVRTRAHTRPSPPPAPARSGTRSMSGTTKRSWKSRIETDSRPCGVSSSERSASVRITTAVEDIAASRP